jgi:hypothetical protein
LGKANNFCGARSDIHGCALNSPAAKEAWDKLRASDRLEGSKATTYFTVRAE